jgi:hypothetical protein
MTSHPEPAFIIYPSAVVDYEVKRSSDWKYTSEFLTSTDGGVTTSPDDITADDFIMDIYVDKNLTSKVKTLSIGTGLTISNTNKLTYFLSYNFTVTLVSHENYYYTIRRINTLSSVVIEGKLIIIP